MTDDDEIPPPPEGFRALTHEDLPPPPEGFRPLTHDDMAGIKQRKAAEELSLLDRARTSGFGAMYQGALRLGQGAEQLAAHGAAAASDLLPVYPVKGSGTGKPAPHSLSDALHGFAGYVDTAIAGQNRGYEEAGERADAASAFPEMNRGARRTGEFIGGVAFPGAGEVLPEVQALGRLGNAALRSGTSGAAYGASQPVLEPKSDRDYWTTKAEQTGTGALTAATLGTTAEALTAPRNAGPTLEQYRARIEAEKNAAYRASEATGATVPRDDFVRALNAAVADASRDVTYREGTHPRTATAIRTAFNEIDQFPADISFRDMDVVRKIMRSALDSPERSERAAAHVIIDGIDDHIQNLNAPEGSALAEARRLASRGFKLEAIADAMQRARNATGSGGWIPSGAHQSHNKFDNAVRLQFKKILDNPRRARQFDADEREVMQTIVDGTNTQNLARRIGVLSPTRNAGSVLTELGAVLGGNYTGHTDIGLGAGLAAAGAGMGGQYVADRISQGNVDRLTNFVATGRQGLINTPRIPMRPGFHEGMQAVQNGFVYQMINGVMVPQRRVEQ